MIPIAVDKFEGWREAARSLLAREVRPDEVLWSSASNAQQPMSFGDALEPEVKPPPHVPKRFIELARVVACHRDPRRWALLYRALFRITHGERSLLDVEVDDDTRALLLMEKAVNHDIHHMHAFVRFRKVGERYIAWYKPDHHVVELASPFFVKRFGNMEWAILTPDASACWNRNELRFGPGVPRTDAPADDALEDLWRDYYSAVFNPARLNPKLLKTKLPVRHWQTLPEALVIPQLASTAAERVQQMIKSEPSSAIDFLPPDASLDELRAAVKACRGCQLYRCATQPVFGRGPADARVMLVGEQPGDQEDLAGEPFVGPAGQLLDRALNDAGISRGELYITNAVKHFKFEERGKRRIHQTPRGPEISACRPWLDAEIAAVKPNLIVCLGATAAQSLFGRAVSVNKTRGRFERHKRSDLITVTLHPSALLRMPDADHRAREYALFIEDFKRIRDCVHTRWGTLRRAA